jgi:uncharacterized repeat protein (TIGR03803 family)
MPSLTHAGNPAQITNALPASQTAHVGDTVNLLVGASGDPVILYQWSFDGAAIAEATNQLLSIPNVQTSNQGSYQVVVTNNFGSSTSVVSVLQVLLTPTVTKTSYSSSVAEGSTASFSVTADGQPPLTYQWDFNGVAIALATNSTLSIPYAQSTNSGTYQVFITNAYGNASSQPLPLTVALAPMVNGTRTSGPAVLGGAATFTAYVQGTPPLSYQWYFEAPDGSSTNALLDATNAVLTITNVQLTNAGSYQLVITNSFGSAHTQPLPLLIVAGSKPLIGGQPSSQSVPQGFLATFQVLASGATPFSYQWSWNGSPLNDATNQTLLLTNAQPASAGSYQVVVSNAFGAQTSAVAVLSIADIATQAPGISLSPLFSFDAPISGSQPASTLIYGADGYLYVTAAKGGTNDLNAGGDGTVSKMDTNGNVLWTVSLSQTSGANPAAGLVDGGGVFYGTAVNGGAGFGTVFRITSSGVLTPLYWLTNGMDGAYPRAALTLGRDGFLYGCAALGGANDVSSGGDGTIFKMTTNGALVWAVSFDSANGRQPQGALVQAANGVLYGTTTDGGANNVGGGGLGTVFSITTNGVLTSLYSFTGGTDGSYPQAGLAVGPDGGLYGTTTGGGNTTLNSGLGFGTVFDIMTNGFLITLADFDGADGVSPQGALVLGSDYNFYGTTARGGVGFPTAGYGTIFRVTINGSLTSLLSFDGGSDGAYPTAGLTRVNPGIFYGTTAEGGTNDLSNGGDGGVFRFASPAGPPSLANIGERVLEVEQNFIFTNQVFGGTPPVTLSLAEGALAGACLSRRGVFCWDPACEQGSTTNLITVWAVDSGSPPQSNAMTFTLIVGPCVQVSLGSGPVQIGQSTCVPITLFSTVSLTNLSFTILTLPDRFANWSINVANNAIAQATVLDPLPSQPQFNIVTQPGQSLNGSSLLGYACVAVLNSGSSTFAPLVPSGIVATSDAGASVTPVFGQQGQLVLIEGAPLLDGTLQISLSPAQSAPLLTLYGNPGTNYFVQFTTNLCPPIIWTTFTNYDLTGLLTNFNQVSPSDSMEFFRALYIGTPPP